MSNRICVAEVNKELKEKMSVALDTKITFIAKPKVKVAVSPPLLCVHWLGKKPRGKSLPVLACTHCPFCGKKYKE